MGISAPCQGYIKRNTGVHAEHSHRCGKVYTSPGIRKGSAGIHPLVTKDNGQRYGLVVCLLVDESARRSDFYDRFHTTTTFQYISPLSATQAERYYAHDAGLCVGLAGELRAIPRDTNSHRNALSIANGHIVPIPDGHTDSLANGHAVPVTYTNPATQPDPNANANVGMCARAWGAAGVFH